MKMTRRQSLRLISAAAACFPASRAAWAQSYPVRPIRLMLGFAAGGGTDIIARMIAESLSRQFGQQVVVENRTGMSGNLAIDLVTKSPPDGYTLLFTGPNSTIGASLYKKLPFDFRRDTVAVAFIMRLPNLMVVSPSLPVTSVKEFIDHAKSAPGTLSFASSGVGTTLHLSGEMFKAMTKIEMTHVPYRGGSAAYADLISGRVQVMFDNVTSGLEMAQSGKVRALGVTSAVRWASLPDMPAIAETVPGFEAMVWYGIVAPQGTPADIVLRLNQAVTAALKDTALAARFTESGGLPMSMTPQQFQKFLDEDVERWRKVVEFAGASVD
jgi:tripartite-type tricarboxylate transporter receptor subunit TctC